MLTVPAIVMIKNKYSKNLSTIPATYFQSLQIYNDDRIEWQLIIGHRLMSQPPFCIDLVQGNTKVDFHCVLELKAMRQCG